MKPKLNRAGLLLMITLVLTLIFGVLAVVSRSTSSADTAIALFLFWTLCVYVSFAAGLLVPIWMGFVVILGGSIERRRMLLLLSALNIAVALTWYFLFVPRMHFRY